MPSPVKPAGRPGSPDLSWLPPYPLTVDDLDILPGDRRYELVDGQLILPSPQPLRHQNVVGHLLGALDALVSGTDLEPIPAPGFSRDAFNYRVPDVAMCLKKAVEQDPWRNHLTPEDCVLLCEIVSESTVMMDRVLKPAEYAGTGVPYYLRVELNDSGRVVKLFLSENIENPHREVESDPERVYRQIGQTMTGGGPLPMPKPFTGPLDPHGL